MLLAIDGGIVVGELNSFGVDASALKLRDAASEQGRPIKPPQHAIHESKYRPDIDGLRTVAVLSVLLFHLDQTLLPGGFVGVDIFFVISGYLITGIVHQEIIDGQFSVLNFYERRMRRIFPALFVAMLCVLTAGLVIFMPDELRDLGSSFVATSLFASNILFWLQADYFSGPVEFKPLLHTWSLAVEEQFYLFAPPLMFVLYRWNAASGDCVVYKPNSSRTAETTPQSRALATKAAIAQYSIALARSRHFGSSGSGKGMPATWHAWAYVGQRRLSDAPNLVASAFVHGYLPC